MKLGVVGVTHASRAVLGLECNHLLNKSAANRKAATRGRDSPARYQNRYAEFFRTCIPLVESRLITPLTCQIRIEQDDFHADLPVAVI
jgi:hypothetical protein